MPLNDFIFSNPDSAHIPIRIVLGLLLLTLFILALGFGRQRAVDIVGRFRWVVMAAFVAASAWGIYAYAVLRPVSSW